MICDLRSGSGIDVRYCEMGSNAKKDEMSDVVTDIVILICVGVSEMQILIYGEAERRLEVGDSVCI